MSAELALPARLLMGAGPTNPDPRVLRAMASGLVGQFDPVFTALMADAQDCLRQVFGTRNRATFPVPGTSRAGMEAGRGDERECREHSRPRTDDRPAAAAAGAATSFSSSRSLLEVDSGCEQHCEHAVAICRHCSTDTPATGSSPALHPLDHGTSMGG
jgi:hypothetical protein